jgi:quercetin dioxygenase-like cupin family protein
MKRILLAASAIFGLAAPAVAQVQQPLSPPSMRKDLQHHDLQGTDREVFQSEVSLEPGASFPRHSHPGEEFIYVLKGMWIYQIDGQPPVTVKAGDALFIPYGAVHSAQNIGSETGIELATHVIEKGKPLLSLAGEKQK